MTSRLYRSALYVPASNAKGIEKARSLPCDVVILDLEDGVAPEAKRAAREQAVLAIGRGGFGSRLLVVRVNGYHTEWGSDDLAAFAQTSPAAILVPKVDSSNDLSIYRRALGPICSADLWAMIETGKSVANIHDIASASSEHRLSCLVLGSNDLCKELRLRPGINREPLFAILGLSVVAARSAGLAILDGVYNSIGDADGFSRQCRQAADFGFDGKTLIHPSQVDACNAAFTPDADAIRWAQRVIAAFGESANINKGAIQVDGVMVERLHLVQAQQTLSIAREAGAAIV